MGIEAFQSRRLENLQTPPGIMRFNRWVSAVDPTQLSQLDPDSVGVLKPTQQHPKTGFLVPHWFPFLWDSRNQLNVPRSHRSYNFSDLKVGHHADGTGGANGFCNKIDTMMPCFLFLLAMSEDVEICV